MGERFTVYSFQLRPDDYTRFVGGYDSDVESYSEEEFGAVEKDEKVINEDNHEDDEGIFTVDTNIIEEAVFVGGDVEKQDINNFAADINDENTFNTEEEIFQYTENDVIGEPDGEIFNLEMEL